MNAQWGVYLEDLQNTPESPACTAYGGYVMGIGMWGETSQGKDSEGTCGMSAGLLHSPPATHARGEATAELSMEGPYRKLAEEYAGYGYQATIKACVSCHYGE